MDVMDENANVLWSIALNGMNMSTLDTCHFSNYLV